MEELCNDIREFVAAVGLPEGHVPSIKELSQHGRYLKGANFLFHLKMGCLNCYRNCWVV